MRGLSEMRRLVRGARRAFLTHLGAVFSKVRPIHESTAKKVGKNGQPPLSVLSGACFAQFEWYRGDTSSSQFVEAEAFIFCKYLFAYIGRKEYK